MYLCEICRVLVNDAKVQSEYQRAQNEVYDSMTTRMIRNDDFDWRINHKDFLRLERYLITDLSKFIEDNARNEETRKLAKAQLRFMYLLLLQRRRYLDAILLHTSSQFLFSEDMYGDYAQAMDWNDELLRRVKRLAKCYE